MRTFYFIRWIFPGRRWGFSHGVQKNVGMAKGSGIPYLSKRPHFLQLTPLDLETNGAQNRCGAYEALGCHDSEFNSQCCKGVNGRHAKPSVENVRFIACLCFPAVSTRPWWTCTQLNLWSGSCLILKPANKYPPRFNFAPSLLKMKSPGNPRPCLMLLYTLENRCRRLTKIISAKFSFRSFLFLSWKRIR